MLNRELQRYILEQLAAIYPDKIHAQEVGWLSQAFGEKPGLRVNMVYLNDHGLIEYQERTFASGHSMPFFAKATHKGMDFLADDGGLSAILGVVTVKLHEETMRSLLLAKVETLDAPPEVKSRLVDTIKSLPAKGLETMALDLIKNGLDTLPEAAGHLMKLLGLG